MIELEIDERNLNNIFFELQKVIDDNSVRYIFCYGGSSSSKSFSAAQLTILNMLSKEDYNTILFRKFLSDIKNSNYSDFKTIIANWGLDEYFELQQNLIKCKINNNYITFRGLDDSSKIKGISNFKKIIVDEVDQIDYLDWLQLSKRLRGKIGQQLICLFNPVSEMSYLKVDIFDKEILIDIPSTIQQKQINADGNMVILRTNYLDNKWCVGPSFYDKHAIASFEKDKVNNWNIYQVYGLGMFGKLRIGGEFFKHFRAEKHCKPLTYNQNIPLHITWDDNVNPHISIGIWQIDGNNIYQIDEIALLDPRNTLKESCNEFISRYKNHLSGLFIYGDATSKKQDTKLEKGENFYTLILEYLNQFKPQLRLLSVNPNIVMSKLFVDGILNEDMDFRITIDSDRCKKAIHDYEYCMEAADGTTDKKMITNKLTGVRYQQYGHFSDTLRYFITTILKNEYQVFLQGGKKRIAKIGTREKQ